MFLIAHRANNNHGFSENSKKAIISCLNTDYIDGIEIDVRITKDKKLILFHDPVIDFSSNRHGIVKHMNLIELEKNKYGKSEEPIATLEEVLKIFNDKILLIELKEIGNDYIDLVDEVVKLIKMYSNIHAYVCSFNFKLLIYLKNTYKDVKCGLIIGYGLNSLKLNNNFDFLVLSFHNLKLLNKKEPAFVFGVEQDEIDKLKEDTYLITDNSYSIVKTKNQ